MFRFLSNRNKARPAATAFALAALLAVLSLQVVEVGHQHDLGDVAEHCLTCKTDGANAVAVTDDAGHTLPVADYRGVRIYNLFSSRTPATNRARAPPHIS